MFYQRDYLHLLVKYGLEEPAEQEMPAAPTRIPGPPQVVNVAELGAGGGVAEGADGDGAVAG